MGTTGTPGLLPEIAEADAQGATREIYAELKRLCAVPMVALIFRHLATMPGALEWAWAALRPALERGLVQEAAWRIAREAPVPALAAYTRESLAPLGVDEAGLAEIRGVALAYNRANPANLLSVRCLAALLEGAQGGGWEGAATWQPPAGTGALVAMGDVTSLSAETAAVLRRLARNEAGGETTLVPSLYRHFLHRPRLLASLAERLVPRFDDGGIAAGVKAIRSRMDAAASDLAGHLRAPPVPHAAVAPALERFGHVIPQMIVVGTLIERALPAPR